MWIVDKLAWDNRIVHPSVDQLVDYDANHMINLPFPKKNLLAVIYWIVVLTWRMRGGGKLKIGGSDMGTNLYAGKQ